MPRLSTENTQPLARPLLGCGKILPRPDVQDRWGFQEGEPYWWWGQGSGGPPLTQEKQGKLNDLAVGAGTGSRASGVQGPLGSSVLPSKSNTDQVPSGEGASTLSGSPSGISPPPWPLSACTAPDRGFGRPSKARARETSFYPWGN